MVRAHTHRTSINPPTNSPSKRRNLKSENKSKYLGRRSGGISASDCFNCKQVHLMQLTFPIEPVPKGRPKFTRSGHCYTPKKTREFEDAIAHVTKAQNRDGIVMQGPLSVSISFFLTRPKSVVRDDPWKKPDLDNLAKSVIDGVTQAGTVWNDDAQICELSLRKKYSDTPLIVVDVQFLNCTT